MNTTLYACLATADKVLIDGEEVTRREGHSDWTRLWFRGGDDCVLVRDQPIHLVDGEAKIESCRDHAYDTYADTWQLSFYVERPLTVEDLA